VKQRRQSPGSRSKPRTTRAKYDCLDVLTGDEAQIVLKDLLSSRPDLISDDVAADVFGALQALDLDDLEAGPRPGGAKRAANALLARVSFAGTSSPRKRLGT
jgi:hypothetical protein